MRRDLGRAPLDARALRAPVRSRVDPGVYYVDEDNVDEPEIQRVVDPPISRWLKPD